MTIAGNATVVRGFGQLFDAGTAAGVPEGELLDRFIARGDEAAFEAIVARHGPLVLGVCRRNLDDPHDIDDAFQATFLVLVRRARSIRDRERLGTWLYAVARSVAQRARRASARRASHEQQAPARSAEPGDRPERDEVRAVLDEEIARLPRRYRLPLILCHLDGRSQAEAAAELRWTPGMVRGRLARAREILRARLTRRGIAAPAVLAGALVVPGSLIAATVRAASRVPAGTTLARGVAMGVLWARLGSTAAVLVVAVGVAAAVMTPASRSVATPAAPAPGWPASPQAPSAKTPKDALERTYVLDAGEDLKCFKPPRDARIAHSEGEGLVNTNENADIFFRWRDGKRKWAMTFGSGRGPELRSVFAPILGLEDQEVEGDPDLLRFPMKADFLVRDGVPPRGLLKPLEEILLRDFDMPARLTLSEEVRDTIVMRGRYAFHPASQQARDAAALANPDRIEVYAHEVGDPRFPGNDNVVTGWFASFPGLLAGHIGLRVIDETEAPPRSPLAFHITGSRLPEPIGAEEREPTLKHLTEQTGLTFRAERRKVRVLRVDRKR
jgi:RNA polymerase sigma factor (sigma-70 family)